MTPREVAAVLREISQLLQLKGENAFEVRADDLEKAAREGRVRGLKGFGEKTERSILEGIAKVRARQTARKPLWETRPLAEQLVARVRAAPGVARAEIAGSVRRYDETNGDIDIVAAVDRKSVV